MRPLPHRLNVISQGVLNGTAWWSACIAFLQFTGAILEFARGQILLLGLDVASGTAASVAVIIRFMTLDIALKRRWMVALLSIAVCAEVETAFHDPEFAYYDSREYLILIVSMLFLAVVFPGTPGVFASCSASYVGLYLLRGFMNGMGSLEGHTLIVFLFQMISAAVVCTGIHYWIFRLRYTNVRQAEELSQTQMRLGRQMMLRDIHDHLGGRLADLSNLIARLREDRSDTMIAAVETGAADVAALLRRGLLAERDREMLSEDFGNALRVILFGRYEAASRQIWFRLRGEAENALTSLSAAHREEVFAMVLEITTNDLRYGRGISVLDVRRRGAFLEIRFLAETFRLRSAGLGRDSLGLRIQRLQGSVLVRSHANRILIKIRIPEIV